MAETTITGLPNATTPLSGAERVPMDQDGQTVDAPASAIAALAPGTDLAYTAATRTLASSTGADVVLPLATTTAPGLAPTLPGGTGTFWRSDGTFATPPGGATDLSYDPATALLSSSTGSDVTLTLADGTNPGLLSAAGFLKLASITPDEARLVVVPVRNNSGSPITKGTPVYVTGSSGTRITIAPADASVEATAAGTLGLVYASISNNADGLVLAVGQLDGISTAGLTEGAIAWLSETTGQITTTRPTAPAHGVVLGYVVKTGSGTSGILYVKVDNGLELDELHNVLIVNPQTRQVLYRNAAGLWVNQSLAAADISDSTALGRSLLTVADAAAARSAISAEQAGAAAAVQASLSARLNQFRDARTFYVSKRIGASDSNNGTSPGEPFLTIGAAVAAVNAFRVANPGEFAAIEIGPGVYVEPALPLRLRPNILLRGIKQRCIRVKPAAGQELNSFVAVDSGCMVCDLTFAGHQAQNTSPTDSTAGTRAWAITFNEQANGGQGVILAASPYIKDCLSLTAEDDAGEAGSTSTGDCGGGVEVDGAKCHPNSPIRSMVVYGFTQQNLGGPGAVIKNDGYAELVSFFGLFGTWHVRCESGGQATLSGGGCSEFGVYGLMADGYSPTALFTGSLRVGVATGALEVDVIGLSANRLGTSSRPAAGQVMLMGGHGYVVQSASPINASGVIVPDSDPTRAGYRVAFFNHQGHGMPQGAPQATPVDFRQRSQISAGCHSANYVGSGTNYSALPWNGGVPIRANEIVETNFGRVFGMIINDVGDVRIAGGAFEIDGTTGAVTINTDQFNLSGLNAIGPFSRNGGVSTVGVQLQEVSNNTSLIASTGIPEDDTVPTQYAVKTYLDSNYSKVFTFEQSTPSGTWTINHNLGYRPAVELINAGGQEIDGEITHTSENQVVVGLSPPSAGRARLT